LKNAKVNEMNTLGNGDITKQS